MPIASSSFSGGVEYSTPMRKRCRTEGRALTFRIGCSAMIEFGTVNRCPSKLRRRVERKPTSSTVTQTSSWIRMSPTRKGRSLNSVNEAVRLSITLLMTNHSATPITPRLVSMPARLASKATRVTSRNAPTSSPTCSTRLMTSRPVVPTLVPVAPSTATAIEPASTVQSFHAAHSRSPTIAISVAPRTNRSTARGSQITSSPT